MTEVGFGAEELALFLQNRANCLMDNGRFVEAKVAFMHSYRLAPQNPLGRAQIDHALRKMCLNVSSDIQASAFGHRSEHAVEVQLPFLQKTLGSFMLLPLVMGSHDPGISIRLGQVIAQIVPTMNVLLVASTDLSHFFSLKQAEILDRNTIGRIAAMDPEGLAEELVAGNSEACGGAPTIAVLTALRALGATRVEVTARGSSADLTHDARSVVGYCSAVVWGNR